MLIEVDDEVVDKLVVGEIAKWVAHFNDIFSDNKGYHEDDLEYWRALLPALKIVGHWYSSNFDTLVEKCNEEHYSEEEADGDV